ncbi:MAG: hypothetical protein R3E04_00085 [Sphingobium sp.]
MPRNQAIRVKEEDTHLELRVESFEASLWGGVNHDALAPEYAWRLDEEDLVYKFTSELRISALTTWPSKRANEHFELTLHGDDRHSTRLLEMLKDIRATDNDGSPRYRTYRGKEIPVLVPPDGLGVIDKVRGESTRRAWLFVTPLFVDQCRSLLTNTTDLFLSIHEWKCGRSRWVRSLSLQTSDPAEE